jgi:hypothetical protein
MTPIDWLLAAIATAILYFVVLLADNLVKKGKGVGQIFWRRHICDDFPYPDECWSCKKSSCRGCDILNRRG